MHLPMFLLWAPLIKTFLRGGLVAAVLSRTRGQLPIRFKCGSTHFTLTGGRGGGTSEVSGPELGHFQVGGCLWRTFLVFLGLKFLGLLKVEVEG